jgi:hypothetical protein
VNNLPKLTQLEIAELGFKPRKNNSSQPQMEVRICVRWLHQRENWGKAPVSASQLLCLPFFHRYTS